MNFQEAEIKYRELRSKLDAGDLTDEEFKDSLKSLMIKDDEGRFWNIGAETGKWYYFDEGEWVEGTPPQVAEAQPDSLASEEAGEAEADVPAWPEEPSEAETVLIASPPAEPGEAEPALIAPPEEPDEADAVPTTPPPAEPGEAETALIASPEEPDEADAVPTTPPPAEPDGADMALPAWLEEPSEAETVPTPSSEQPGAAPTIIGAPLLPRLVVASGSRQGEKFTLSGEVRLGREDDNDIVMDDPKASRHHAVFRAEAGEYTITDLGSINGTFVNGRQIAAPQILAEGDAIVVGDTELTYHAGLALGEPAAEPVSETGPTLVGEAADATLPPAPSPPAYAPPPTPPVPAYAPPPAAPPEPAAPPAKKRGFSTCLIVIIVLAILLCCAVVIVGALAWQVGFVDTSILP